ncbi:MAG TPA: AsmA family protein [Chromatiales bacterium]|nr:AsmA family protein [Chromatiales bacterium]
MFKRFLKYLLITTTLLGTLLFSIPFIVPLESFRTILEEQLSQSIGRKVIIGELTPHAVPLPALTATNVSILNSPDQPGELFVEQMRTTLDPLALLDGKIIINTIHLNGVGTNLKFINALITPPRNAANSTSHSSLLAVRQISGSNVMLQTDAPPLLGPYRFNLQLDSDFNCKEISFARMDNTLQAILKPNTNNTFNLRASGKNWHLPVSPAFNFDRLNVQAVIQRGKAELTRIEINGYGGSLTTSGTLSWGERWSYQGKLKSSNLQLAPILKQFDINTYEGRFHSDLTIRLDGKNPAQLFTDPEAKGTYHISHGLVKREEDGHVLLRFDEFSANGDLSKGALINENNILKTAGGTIQGITHLFWKEQWKIEGWVVASEIDAERLLSGFIDDKVTSGTFYATTEFSFTERDNEGLLENPYLNGHFRMTDGKLYKADLEKASTTLSSKGSQGGDTPFQRLTGNATIADHHITITDIDIISDSLSAHGDITINPQDALEGEVTVALRRTASIISAPLKVGGTVNNPRLRLTNDVIIGGVIGTSVLGPGIGTAVGMKVGHIIKKIGSALGQGEAKADLLPTNRQP